VLLFEIPRRTTPPAQKKRLRSCKRPHVNTIVSSNASPYPFRLVCYISVSSVGLSPWALCRTCLHSATKGTPQNRRLKLALTCLFLSGPSLPTKFLWRFSTSSSVNTRPDSGLCPSSREAPSLSLRSDSFSWLSLLCLIVFALAPIAAARNTRGATIPYATTHPALPPITITGSFFFKRHPSQRPSSHLCRSSRPNQ